MWLTSADDNECQDDTCWHVTHSVLVVVAPVVAAVPVVTAAVREAPPATPELAPAPPERLNTIWPAACQNLTVHLMFCIQLARRRSKGIKERSPCSRPFLLSSTTLCGPLLSLNVPCPIRPSADKQFRLAIQQSNGVPLTMHSRWQVGFVQDML